MLLLPITTHVFPSTSTPLSCINSIIPAGSLVKVLEISGVKLIVEPHMEDTQSQKLTEPKEKVPVEQSEGNFDDDFDDDLDDTDDFI